MIGLNEESADIWTSKLIKLLVYPELIQKAQPPSPMDDEYLDSKSLFDGSAIMDMSLLDPPSLSIDDDSSDYSGSSEEGDEEGSEEDEAAFVDAPLSPIPDSPDEFAFDLRGYSSSATTTFPFFGLTRTSDGTSLTANVHHLATLFPKEERYMLLCADELDWVELDTRDESEGASTPVQDMNGDEDAYMNASILRCLQIDLRVFGLGESLVVVNEAVETNAFLTDKHGLVARFSDILNSNGINHQYSSAFKTANLLVSHVDAERALSMLGSC